MRYDNETKLQQALKVVLKEFENYKKNLIDKSILVIYRNRETKNLDYIIIEFTGSNYYHLTGVIYKEDDGDTTKSKHFGSKFYNALEDKKLSASELKIKDNNTELKIKALPFISSQYRYSNMTGDFNESGLKLQLDKVIGNTKTCLGLRKIGYKKYAPASSLYDDTRKYAKISREAKASLFLYEDITLGKMTFKISEHMKYRSEKTFMYRQKSKCYNIVRKYKFEIGEEIKWIV